VTPLNDRLVTTRSALLLLWVAVGFVVLVARVPCWRGPRLVQGSLAVRTALRPDAWLIQQLPTESLLHRRAHNGSSHRGAACFRCLQTAFPNLVAVHGPIHASGLKPNRNLLLDCPT
jgi:hypothetical protein